MNISSSKIRLEEAIVETIAFFDMFDFPLTAFEIWQYSKIKCQLIEINSQLLNQNFLNKYKLDKKNGFYFFEGKAMNIQKRLNRYNFSERKYKRAIKVTKIFSLVPWIKLVAVGNMIGANNLKDSGDIDLFIITDDKRIWLSRLFCVSIIKLLNLRPKPGREKDTICLSFFVTMSKLNLKGLMLNKDDIYFVHWLAGLVPILNRDDIFSIFLENNNWISDNLPNWRFREPNIWRYVSMGVNSFIKDMIDLFVGGLEPLISKWQLKILPASIKTVSNIDTKVVITDDVLKFHVNDRREYYSSKYLRKIKILKNEQSR